MQAKYTQEHIRDTCIEYIIYTMYIYQIHVKYIKYWHFTYAAKGKLNLFTTPYGCLFACLLQVRKFSTLTVEQKAQNAHILCLGYISTAKSTLPLQHE